MGPVRDDYYFARLGMDVVSPHLKRGKKPKFEDHQIKWDSRKKKQDPMQMLAEAKRITGIYTDIDREKRKKSQSTPRKEVTDGHSRGTNSRAERRRRRS